MFEDSKFINDPTDPGQLGAVIDTKELDITKEAKDVLRTASREGGSFAPLMLTKHGDGSGSSIGVMGYGKIMFNKEDIKIGRDCSVEILDDLEDAEIAIPEDFKEAVDS